MNGHSKDGLIIQYPIVQYPDVSTRDVENLLASLGLDHGRVHPITGGWSYWTFEVELDGHDAQAESRKSGDSLKPGDSHKPGECHNPGWIFRFPRNSVVAENLQKEQAVLPIVASRVDFAVPRFEHAGFRNGQPFAGYRRIPGRPLSDHPFNTRGLADETGGSVASAHSSRELPAVTAEAISAALPSALAAALTSALSSLHAIPTSLVAEACAVEPTVDAWQQRYHALRETVLTMVSPLLDSRLLDAVERGFERFLQEDLATLKDVALVHCDLGCEHILIRDDGTTVNGLIDFEDATIGDPTIDFVGIFVTCGMKTVEGVRAGYHLDLDANFEHRLRFYTWMASCHQVIYGLEEGKADVVEDGVEGLRTRLGSAGLL